MNSKLASLLAVFVLGIGAAQAAPVLKAEVTVAAAVVTIGDMFEEPGDLAGTPLFRAPLPGTAGTVTLEAVRGAAAAAGLTDFVDAGVSLVRVARAGTLVDATQLAGLIAADLRARGIAGDHVTVQAVFDAGDIALNVEAVANPVQLVSLRYTPGNQGFNARFLVVGREQPVDLTGRIELMVEAPHLVETRPAGTILQPADIEMRLVPLRFAETAGIPRLDQLVGKQLTRHSHSGLMLKASDVSEPLVVQRNSMVTVYLRSGPMTLSINGQALNGASVGQPVQVLNPVSRKILYGVALDNGSVGVSPRLTVAGL